MTRRLVVARPIVVICPECKGIDVPSAGPLVIMICAVVLMIAVSDSREILLIVYAFARVDGGDFDRESVGLLFFKVQNDTF